MRYSVFGVKLPCVCTVSIRILSQLKASSIMVNVSLRVIGMR